MTAKLDHLVLPVADLATARARLIQLGFIVAPDARHPFGTANACVYMGNGSYLEPLAVADAEAAAQAIRAGNVFVARDHVFRAVIGEEGVSAFILASDDAEADHARYLAAQISAGEMLNFSRPFVDASGKSDMATFRLAFAGSPEIADAFACACERVNAPNVDRSALTGHANGVRSIARLVVNPDADAYLRLAGQMAGEIADFSLSVEGGEWTERDQRTIQAIVFRVAELDATERLLEAAKVDFRRGPVQIVVPPAPGQGVHFVFEDESNVRPD